MGKPTLAVLRVEPSFVPSPVTPTISPRLRRVLMRIFLSSGEDRAKTWRRRTTLVCSWGVESAEEGVFHGDPSGGVDTTLSRDRASCEDVVSGTHLDGDTSLAALGGSITCTKAEGIFDTGDSYQGRIVRKLLVRNFVCRVEVEIGRGPRIKVLCNRARGFSTFDWCGR